MKPINMLIDVEIHKKIKFLGVEQDKSIQKLVTEALEDLLRKYGKM